MISKGKAWRLAWTLAWVLAIGAGNAAQATIYVYQLPGGTRIVTDHPVNSEHYTLVRKTTSVNGIGRFLAHPTSQNMLLVDPSTYDQLILQTAAAHRMDAALVKAVVHAESGFNPRAISRKGATGLMQLMPATAKRYGVRDLHDPAENVRGGVLYLKFLLQKFNHNHRLALAAYNAGENAVIRYKGIPPYIETQDYVRKVLQYKVQYTGFNAVAAATPRVEG